ncbi:hypothetical protein I4U23_010863 [Adineta vaga]|nr:hypothetical protein I4U23_010863 [Adineta vaga]
MAQSLVIFDYSGSMAGDRYNKCREACSKFTDSYELWLFGSDVQEKGVVRSLPAFDCNSGTSITLMLEKLYAWMSAHTNKYVYILTDGEDNYDYVSFTNRFDQIKNRNHQVTVYDVCGTNVEQLKKIFANFGIRVARSHEEITNLVQNLQAVMAKDKEIITSAANINLNIQELMSNMQKLERGAEDLKKKSAEIQNKSQNTTNNAKNALVAGDIRMLSTVADDLKTHVKELAEHIHKLKKNEKEARKLQIEAEEIQDSMDELKSNISAELNSPLANQQKLAIYKMDLLNKEHERSTIIAKLQAIEKDSASQITEFKQLENKVSAVQIKVTETMKLGA